MIFRIFIFFIKGMILLSELSRRRIRSIAKLIRVNRSEVAMVIRCDQEKGLHNEYLHIQFFLCSIN